MKKIIPMVLATALTFGGALSTTAVFAQTVHEVNGTITVLHAEGGTLILSDGEKYVVPSTVDLGLFTESQNVKATWQQDGPNRLIVDLVATEGDLAPTATVAAPVQEITGSIMAMNDDKSGGSVILSDGESYVVPSTVDLSLFSETQNVTVTWQQDGDNRLIVDMVASDGDLTPAETVVAQPLNEITGPIKVLNDDEGGGSLILSDGEKYVVPSSIDLAQFTETQNVTVTWQQDGDNRLIVEIIRTE